MTDDYRELINQFADKRVRNAAIVQLLGALNARDLARVTVHPEVKVALMNGLQHHNAKVRWWCLQLMDHLADESFIPAILPLLNDPVAKVRQHAVHALICDICKPERCALDLSDAVRSRLESVASSDTDARVRDEAQRGLSNWANRH